MLKKNSILICSLLLISSCSKVESNDSENENSNDRNIYIEWENTIGGFSWDILSSVEQTSDGGYIVGGSSNSQVGADKTESSWVDYHQDYWVVKLNNIGEIEWQNSIGGFIGERMEAGVHQTVDGGYIIGGKSSSDQSGDKLENNKGSTITTYDFWIVKLDALGNIQWQNTIGGSKNEDIRTISQTSDGGYLIGGDSNSEISADKSEGRFGSTDYWVVKLDPNGIVQWDKTFGGTATNHLGQAFEINNNEIIIGGTSNSYISGNKTAPKYGNLDYWMLKLDANGDVLWQATIGEEFDSGFDYMTPISDGNYLLVGDTGSEDNHAIRIVKIDSSGTIIWHKLIEGFHPGSGKTIQKVIQTVDNSIVLGGTLITTNGPFQYFDFFLLKIDENGNQVNQTILETPGYDKFADLNQTSDSGYIIGGESWSLKSKDKSEDHIGNSSQASDYWVIKISSDF